MASHVMTQAERMCLHSAARDLHTEFRGIFGEETIEELVLDSYAELAATATVTRWLAVGAERFARQRLQALAHAQAITAGRIPSVLFVCVHNAGRSQMALGWFNHLADGRAIAWSGGSEPLTGLRSRCDRRDGGGGHRHLGRVLQTMDRRVRPGRRHRHHDGLRRRVSAPARQALRGLGTRRPGRQHTRGDPARSATRSEIAW